MFLQEGYKRILLKEDFHYRQMSGGRFLVSLKDVYRSESIIKLKTILRNNIELTSISVSSSDEQTAIIEHFITEIGDENFDYLTISQDTIDVIIRI